MSAQVELFELLTEYEHKLRKLLLKHERKTPAPEVEYKPEPRCGASTGCSRLDRVC